MSIETPYDEFRGFEEARTLMWCHEARTLAHQRLESTAFLDDMAVAAVNVENTSRADRVVLTTFDQAGRQLGGETLYVDEPGQHLDVTPEFDHDFTSMQVPQGSELEQAIACEDGWVIDMEALRLYDPLADRRATQRAVLLAHLADMMASGQARGFLLGQLGDPKTA
ncbi:hypothetical protein [Arthrobacter pigmenti]